MDKRLLKKMKKIVLGSIVASVAASASAIFYSNVSNQNSTQNFNNTASHKSIYAQKNNNANSANALSTSSTAFMSKPAGAENSITSSYQNVNPATTKILQIPPSYAQSHTNPTTTTSTDGVNVHTFKGFHGENATFTATNGTPGAWDPATESVTVTGIKQGAMESLKVYPKPGFRYPNPGQGVMTRPWTPVQTYVGIPKPKVTSSGLDPLSTISHDGEAEFTLSIWDPNTMNISLASGSAGTLGSKNRLSTPFKIIKVTGLAYGEQAKLQVSLKGSGERWTDGTKAAVQSIFTPKARSSLPKPTFTHTVKQPTTPTASDGEVTFTLTHFIPEMMSISLSHGSWGTLGTYDPQTKQIKVTGLKISQYTRISVSPKTTSKSGTMKAASGMGVDDDQTSKANMNNGGGGNEAIKTVTLTMDEINEVDIKFLLKSLKSSALNPDYFSIQNTSSPFAKSIHTSFEFDYNTNKWTFRGKEVEGKAHAAKWILDSKTSAGNHSQSEAKVWVESFDKANNQIVIKYSIRLSVNGGGEDNAGMFFVQLQPNHLRALWSDYTTNQVESSSVTIGLTKTTFTKTVKQPTTTTSTDGEVTYTLTNFDPNKMDVSLVAGSNGTLGSYDPITKQIKVTGLSNGQHAQISVALKNSPVTISSTAKRYNFPGFGIEDDDPIDPNMWNGYAGPNVKTQTFSVGDAQQLKYSFYLKGNNSSTVKPFYQDIEDSGAGSVWSGTIAGLFNFDAASQKWTANGNSIESKANRVKWTQDVTSNSGGKQTFEFSMWVESFDKTTKQITFKSQLNFPHGTVFGEANGIVADLFFEVTTSKWTPTWSDGTTAPQQSTTFTAAQTYVGLTKTTFTKVVKQPTTTTSTDGEVTFTLADYDETKMDISLVAGSSGTLGSYDPITKQIKVTGLSNSQHAQISVSLKNSIETIQSFGIEDDNSSSNPSVFWKDGGTNTRDITLKASVNNEVGFNSVLKSWKSGDANPTLAHILSKGAFSQLVNGSFIFDSASQKWTSNGASVETRAHALEFVLDSENSGGNASQSKLLVWVESFDKATKQLNIKIELTMPVNGGGEDNAAVTDITFYVKPVNRWLDGTTTIQQSTTFTAAQTYVGLTKTTFTKTVTQPITTTSLDGVVTFTLTNFDETALDISLVSGSSGTLGSFDSHTNTVKVTGVAVGQHAQIQVIPKTNEAWKDGTLTAQQSTIFNPAQTYVGFAITTFSNTATQPKTTTSTDGEVTFTLTNYDPNNMTLALAPGSSGTLGSFDSHTNTIKVTQLSNGQHAQIQVTLGSYIFWTDGTTAVLKSASVDILQTNAGLTRVTFSNTVTQPTTTTSTDGEVTFTLTDYDSTKMDISLFTGSNGTLGTFDAQANTIKVTGLVSGQHAQIQVILKPNNIWAGTAPPIVKSSAVSVTQTYAGLLKTTFTNTVVQPITTTSTDGEVTFNMTYFNPARMDVGLATGSSGTLGTFDSLANTIKVTGLVSGQHAQIQVTLKTNNKWADGTTVVVSSASVDILQTNAGLTRVTFSNTVTQPTTRTSNDGEVVFTLTDYDSTKMDISLATGSDGTLGTFDAQANTVKVSDLSNGQHVQIKITLKTRNVWLDGQNDVLSSSSINIVQTVGGLAKTTFTKAIKQPTTTTSLDSEVIFTVTNYIPAKMDISLVAGSTGTLGTYDPATKQIKVTGVVVGQHAQIQVVLKANEVWLDATTTAQKSSTFTPVQTFVGITKTSFSNTVIQPTTSTSTDGEVTFTLIDFDRNKMDLSVAAGASGTLGMINSRTSTVKVTNLSNRQYAQIQVTLKTNDIWADGTTAPVKSAQVNISQNSAGIIKPTIKQVTKQPATTTSTDGEVTFAIKGFDSTKMVIALAPGSSGTLQIFDPQTQTVKVTNLSHGQKAQIQLTLKPTFIWGSGEKTPAKSFAIKIKHDDSWLKKVEISSVISAPSSSGAKDGKVVFEMKNFEPSKMSVNFAKNSDGTIGNYDPDNGTLEIVGLSSGKNVQVEVKLKRGQFWLDGTNDSVQSKQIRIIDFGIKLVKVVDEDFIQPTANTTGTITLTLENYDTNNITASIGGVHGTISAYDAQTKQIKVTGLNKKDKVSVEFNLKPNNHKTGSKNYWADGSIKPQTRVFFMGYKKIMLDNIELSVPPKVGSKNGKIIFDVPKFDPKTMEVKLVKGSNGVLGKFNPATKKIEVSQIQIGEYAQIQIVFKDKTVVWSDGSNHSLESEKINMPTPYATDPSSSALTQGSISKLVLTGIILGTIIFMNIGWIGVYKVMKSRRNNF